ncbi:MAG: right-handed parallel beta-helix repeat-containing protein [Nannocystaceae bacterium]
MIAVASLLVSAQLVAATIDVNNGDNLFDTLQGLQAGDEVIVHAGTYPVPGFVNLVLSGTENAPIIIRAADGDEVIIAGIDSQNAINVEGSWYTLRGLKVVGGSHGVRLGSSSHATIEGLEITETGDVGISCNRPDNTYEALTIRGNHIHHTGMGGGPGECMYLGCNDDGCQMWDSVIEFNWCHDTTAGSQGDGIEVKTGSYNNLIRHNVIHDVKYPGITIYGTVDNKAPNVVEGNAVWNVVDNGIQTVGDAIVRNNLVFDVGANGIHAKPSQGEIVELIDIVHNTIINPGGVCLRGNEWPGGDGIVVADNAFYCPGGTAIKLPSGAGSATIDSNAVVGGVEGAPMGTFDGVSVDAAFIDAGAKDVYPKGDSPLVDAGAAGHAELDFNCLPRDPNGVEVGAYDLSDAQNPGWAVGPGFKTCADGGDSDGTTTGDSDGSTGGETTGDATDGTTGAPTTGDTTDGTTGDASTGTTGGDGTGSSGGDSSTGSATGDATATATAGSATAGSATTGDAMEDDEEGCACHVDAQTSSPRGLALFALAGLIAFGRRRRE